MLSHEQVRRHVSVDFTVPAELRDRLRLSDADEYAVPLAFVAKRPLVHFDLRNEEGHAIPLLTAEQSNLIARELLNQVLETDLAAEEAAERAPGSSLGSNAKDPNRRRAPARRCAGARV